MEAPAAQVLGWCVPVFACLPKFSTASSTRHSSCVKMCLAMPEGALCWAPAQVLTGLLCK